jgi:hypothetical protein
MITQLGWEPLQVRSVTIHLLLLFKIQHNLVAIPAEAYIFFHQTPGLEVRIPSGFHQPGRMSTETPFSPRSIRKWNNLPSAATIASSVGEFRDTLGNLPPAQFLTV